MNKIESQRGMTVIEFLLSAIVTAIILIAALALIAKYARATSAAREVSELEELRGATADIIKTDFEGAGRNLTRPQFPGAGTEPGQFTSDPNYSSSSGVAVKTGPTGWTTPVYLTRGLGSGTGSMTFTPPGQSSETLLYGANGQYFGIAIGTGGWMGVYENGVEVAATCCYSPSQTVPVHSAGVSYTLAVEAKTSAAPGQVLKLYRVVSGAPSLIWTASMAVPSYPLDFVTYLYNQNDSQTSVSLSGAPLITLAGGATELSLMPFDRGTRLGGPITITNNGQSATILSGDSRIDTAYTTASFVSTTAGGALTLITPKRGVFLAGDVVEVIDFAAGRACLYQVLSATPSAGSTTALALSVIDSTHPAWGRLSSSTTDAQYTFPQGTAVVRLKPPVTYSLTSDSRLVRMEGNQVSTAAYNVRAFSISELASAGADKFQIALSFAAEGFETSPGTATENLVTVEYLATPRALNFTANELN